MLFRSWTQAYDEGFQYGCMTTNIAESINGVFKGACMLTITALVQLTFYTCVASIGRQRAKTQSKRKSPYCLCVCKVKQLAICGFLL